MEHRVANAGCGRLELTTTGHGASMISFERSSVIPLGAHDTFDLELDIDTHMGSMAASGERAIAGVTTGIIGLGETVTWRARHFGITWSMTTLISEMDRPNRFVDRQQRGPFKDFVHEHTFVPVDGGTLATDRVQFAAPLGPLGWIAEQLVLKHYLPKLIDARNEFMVAIAADRGR
jgi:ligand-binding SRPBCC domain-containing protein